MNNNKLYIFVAEWCPYCRQAKEHIFDLVSNYYDNGNIDLLEDGTEEHKKMAVKLQKFGLPTFVVVDENYKEVASWDGPRDYYNLLNFYIKNTETKPLDKDMFYFEKKEN